jgi:hypothetical protein
MLDPAVPTTPPGSHRRGGHGRGGFVPGPTVLAILILTCLAMLGAIYWVVRTGKL